MPYESCAMLQLKRLGWMPKLDVWRPFQQRQPVRTLTQDKKERKKKEREEKEREQKEREKKPLFFRKHWAQPNPHGRIQHERSHRLHARFKKYWRTMPVASVEPGKKVPRPLRPTSKYFPDPTNRTAGSLTQIWLSRFVQGGRMVPKRLSRPDFPARDVSGLTNPPGPKRKHTEAERRRVEAVLTIPIPPLAEWVSPEMMNLIRRSPFKKQDEDAIVIRSDRLRTRGKNLLQCYLLQNRFLRNVASEIVYRERRVEADEMMYREEGAVDDPE